ncbi:helix-turn-helix domain-containing protein [Catenibacterium mitsuokai]|uniref:helix-turn-helix domain-containing protein n=1 Tax=Catenibacterium mitsuokai TaxID=100886 RepID=UPI00242D54B4|nr:helix-turn-helix transcriptional regulator [Catenibacterium mitsuokai]MCI6077822.1 helix-turn-helix domain-containing protein [Catenibacterium mitsuokai]MDD6596265.1 helix-turn-helix transcriptional regulator [Catenibacterium mitsuokai]
MILADKIIEERKKNGWSQEELANKLGVSRQAVSKWESAGSIPDLQRILQMSELFGVTTDYLLKDEIEEEPLNEYVETKTIKVSMEEANQYLDMKSRGSRIVANATSLCILSPVPLIVLGTMTEDHILIGFSLVLLLVLVAIAVYLFVNYGLHESHMQHLEKESFETEYGVSGMVRERREQYEPTFTRNIAIGVVLCILSVIPTIMAGVMEVEDYMSGISVGLLLIIVSIGVNILIRAGMIKSSYDTLLQEGEYTIEEKHLKKKTDAFSGAYWCLIVAIYLGWSFWTNNWKFTWIIWPVAGVLYAAVLGMVKMNIEGRGK